MMAFNPFEFQRQMFVEFEKSMGEYLQKTMRDPEFMKLMARGMDGALDYRGVMKTQIEATLKTLQLPTEESQEKLYGTIHGMETRLLDLEEEVQDLRDTVLSAASALTASLKQLAEVREQLAQATAALNAVQAPAKPRAPRAPRAKKGA